MHLAPANMRTGLGYFAVMFWVGTACTASGPVGVDPDEASADGKADGSVSLPDIHCDDAPGAGPHRSFRHTRSKLISALGDTHHRGIDLVVAATSDEQHLIGETSYGGIVGKSLEDEDIDVFACRAGAWKKVGTARTDDEGRFDLVLEGSARLPRGMRDMYMSVAGDRSGASFLAVVAPDDTQLAVSDIDGTLTSSENAAIGEVIGVDPDIHDGASEAWQLIAGAGVIPVYTSARARHSTASTREWLAGHDMPRGPVRLAPHVLLPGSATSEYTAGVFDALAAELPIAIGVGNRETDIDAYAHAGLAGDQIFIKLPEFEGEVEARLAAGEATGFTSYDELRPF
jgi:phosphatidate phosphatase PAH1